VRDIAAAVPEDGDLLLGVKSDGDGLPELAVRVIQTADHRVAHVEGEVADPE